MATERYMRIVAALTVWGALISTVPAPAHAENAPPAPPALFADASTSERPGPCCAPGPAAQNPLEATAVREWLRDAAPEHCVSLSLTSMTGPQYTFDPNVAQDRWNGPTIEAYGPAVAPFVTLDADFAQTFGAEAMFMLHVVAPPQCPAVDALSVLHRRESQSLNFDVEPDRVSANGVLAGVISQLNGRDVRVWSVDAHGVVSDVTSLVRRTGDGRASFGMTVRSRSGEREPILLFAVAANRLPPVTLAPGARAQDAFPLLVKALDVTGTSSAGAAIGFAIFDPAL